MLRPVFTNATDNGDSLEVEHPGGDAEMIVTGTFGGCTVTPYANYPQVGVDVPIDQGGEVCIWQEPLIKTIRLKHACTLKLVISGAGGSTDINAWI